MTGEFLASHELEVKKLSLGSNGAIKQAARAGLGVSLQSQLTVGLELELGLLAAVRPRDAALPERHWYLLRPANTRARPPVEQFVEFVRGAAGQQVLRRAQLGGGAEPLHAGRRRACSATGLRHAPG